MGFDFSTFSNNSRGVMVLLDNNFEHTVERVQTDQNGNYIILDIAIQGKRITLANLYGPNDDKKKVREKSRECHNHKLQPFPDTKRKRKPTNPNKHKSNKHTKSTKISSLFPKRGNRNAKRIKKKQEQNDTR